MTPRREHTSRCDHCIVLDPSRFYAWRNPISGCRRLCAINVNLSKSHGHFSALRLVADVTQRSDLHFAGE